MGKTWRKDGNGRNKFFVQKKKGTPKKPVNRDYERMINEYVEDNNHKEINNDG